MAQAPAIKETKEAGDVVTFQHSRLPYHPVIQERFGIDRSGWKALVEAVYPNARTTDSVVMALSYCKARKLDPFKRAVHIVPMYQPGRGGADGTWVETIWPGVSELRTTAFRTGQYAGMDAAEFGPTIEREFVGTHRREAITEHVSFPEWCQVNVWRLVGNQRVLFASPKVYWLETYARIGKTAVPNSMWAKRPFGQIEKCTEAAGLRRAFPEEIGNDYSAEEMEGQHMLVEAQEPVRPETRRAPPQTTRTEGSTAGPAQQQGLAPEQPPDPDVEMVAAGREEPGDVVWDDGESAEQAKIKQGLLTLVAQVNKVEDLDALARDKDFYASKTKLSPADADEVDLTFMRRNNELRFAKKA